MRLPRIADARIVYRLLIVNALVVAVPLVGIAFARMHEQQLLARLEADLVDQGELVRAMLEASPDGPGPQLAAHERMLAAAAKRTRTRIRLLDGMGAVVADSHERGPPEGAETTVSTVTGDVKPKTPRAPDPIDVSDRREVRQALAGRFGTATRIWSKENRVYLFVALPVRWQGEVAGAVYITRSTAPVKVALYELRRWLFWLAALSVVATTIVTIILAFTISRPLAKLTRAAERIAAGDHRPIAPGLERGDEIGKLARAVDRMATELDRRAVASRDLAADASHELRAPLSSIQGAAELLRDGAADDPGARDRFLAMILDDASRLDRLVGRLLELARAEANDAPAEELDWREVVAAAIGRVRDVPVTLDYRARTAVMGRRGALASALDNVLANSAAHAAADTRITVTVRESPDGLRTAVHNHGRPIPPTLRVWDRFVTTRAGGTGLGLAIVRSAVEQHGGDVGVTSDAATGTTFWFTLPTS